MNFPAFFSLIPIWCDQSPQKISFIHFTAFLFYSIYIKEQKKTTLEAESLPLTTENTKIGWKLDTAQESMPGKTHPQSKRYLGEVLLQSPGNSRKPLWLTLCPRPWPSPFCFISYSSLFTLKPQFNFSAGRRSRQHAGIPAAKSFLWPEIAADLMTPF